METIMILLIAGLILFIGAHSIRIFSDATRTKMIEKIGLNKWKGLVTLLSIAGFALLVIGYQQARMTPVPLWEPPVWGRYLAVLLNLFAFILITAAYVPGNSIKARIGHPMVASVKIWALAHLLANGNLVDLVLFGTFLIWAVLDFRVSRKRDRTENVVRPVGVMSKTLITVAIGVVLWAAFVLYLHAYLVGVQPLVM
jgi:uncharacterized membrane protein